MDLKPLSRLVPRATKTLIGKKPDQATIARLVMHWADIIGPEMADKSVPAGIYWRKAGEESHGTLQIETSSAHAVRLAHQEAMVAARANRIFGYSEDGPRKITRLQVIHSGEKARPKRKAPPRQGVLTPEDMRLPGAVADPVLRERLEALASAMGKKPD